MMNIYNVYFTFANYGAKQTLPLSLSVEIFRFLNNEYDCLECPNFGRSCCQHYEHFTAKLVLVIKSKGL